MSEPLLHHRVSGNMNFVISKGEPTLPAGTINNYKLSCGEFSDQIGFQNGPVNGSPNGFSIEAVLETCLIRLQALNSGKFECIHNHIAIEKLRGAIDTLNARTEERNERGVEGTNQA